MIHYTFILIQNVFLIFFQKLFWIESDDWPQNVVKITKRDFFIVLKSTVNVDPHALHSSFSGAIRYVLNVHKPQAPLPGCNACAATPLL